MRVLLVDDEPELVEALAERLELRGHQVDAVTTGAEALDRVRAEVYDVVVADVKMPGMSGHALLATVRTEQPELPVILLTGHGADDEGETQAAVELACAYLFKPVNIDELLRTMTLCAGGH